MMISEVLGKVLYFITNQNGYQHRNEDVHTYIVPFTFLLLLLLLLLLLYYNWMG